MTDRKLTNMNLVEKAIFTDSIIRLCFLPPGECLKSSSETKYRDSDVRGAFNVVEAQVNLWTREGTHFSTQPPPGCTRPVRRLFSARVLQRGHHHHGGQHLGPQPGSDGVEHLDPLRGYECLRLVLLTCGRVLSLCKKKRKSNGLAKWVGLRRQQKCLGSIATTDTRTVCSCLMK